MPWTLFINGNRYDSTNFSGFNYAQESTGLVAILNDIVQHNLNSFRFSSSDTIAYANATANITIEQNKPFLVGTSLRLTDIADSANYLLGHVEQYDANTGALTLQITEFSGSGDNDDWVGQMAFASPQSIAQIEESKATVLQALADTQAISESGLPYQTNNKNKSLVTNGTTTSWQFPTSINRRESGNFILYAGDYVLVTAATEIIYVTLPALTGSEPFIIKNSARSNHSIELVKPNLELIAPNKFIYKPSDKILIEPGEQLSILIDDKDITIGEVL